MNATQTELHPTTKIDLRKSHGNWEPNETSRTPMHLQPGQNPWTVAHAMMADMESARAFRPESHVIVIDSEKRLEWWLRTFCDEDDLRDAKEILGDKNVTSLDFQQLESELADALCRLEGI